MAVASGQYGKVMIGASTVMECQSWRWSRTVADHAYASCATSGWKKRVAGTKDHSGSIAGKLDLASQLEDYFDEGDLVELNLYCSTTDYYIVPAMITSLDVEVDIDEGDIIGWSAEFGGNGQWSSSGM